MAADSQEDLEALEELFDEHEEAGRLAEAEAVGRRLYALDPHEGLVLRLLGLAQARTDLHGVMHWSLELVEYYAEEHPDLARDLLGRLFKLWEPGLGIDRNFHLLQLLARFGFGPRTRPLYRWLSEQDLSPELREELDELKQILEA